MQSLKEFYKKLYQEINQGNVVRLTDLNGNTLDLTDEYGYFVIDVNPQRPTWAN
jgi:hypothetical protein